MKELKVIDYEGMKVVDSREVAKTVGKPHNDLMKDIRRYISYLGEGNFSQSDFFVESSYLNSQNKEQPCYQITKKGCEMIANKMTGKKGIQFTATYVNAFNIMLEEKTRKVESKNDEVKLLNAQARERNSRSRLADMWLKIANLTKSEVSHEICASKASEVLNGTPIIQLPKIDENYYSATEVGKMLGLSSNKIGRIAKENGIKSDTDNEYGKWFADKSKYSNKEVSTFRYNDNGVEAIKKAITLTDQSL